VYRKLYEEGVCILEDFFDDPKNGPGNDPNYPPPLFACTEAQAQFITKKSVSCEIIFDGVRRSNETCGYHTHFEEEKKVNKNKLTGRGPRQQLKPCKVLFPLNNHCDPPALSIKVHLCITMILFLMCKR
jgi:hypothetical protein